MTKTIFIAALEYAFLNCQDDERLSTVCEDIHDAIKAQIVKSTKTGDKIYKDAGIYVSVGKPAKDRRAAFYRIIGTVEGLDCFAYPVDRKELKAALKYALFTYADYLKAIV